MLVASDCAVTADGDAVVVDLGSVGLETAGGSATESDGASGDTACDGGGVRRADTGATATLSAADTRWRTGLETVAGRRGAEDTLRRALALRGWLLPVLLLLRFGPPTASAMARAGASFSYSSVSLSLAVRLSSSATPTAGRSISATGALSSDASANRARLPANERMLAAAMSKSGRVDSENAAEDCLCGVRKDDANAAAPVERVKPPPLLIDCWPGCGNELLRVGGTNSLSAARTDGDENVWGGWRGAGGDAAPNKYSGADVDACLVNAPTTHGA